MFKSIRILRTNEGMIPEFKKVEARRQLSSTEYVQLLTESGFGTESLRLEKTEVPIEGWLGISCFQDFCDGAMVGIPPKLARQLLQEGIPQTLRELALETVPRNWLSIVARKR